MTTNPAFITPRDTVVPYRRLGRGTPLICVPGGPLLPAAYLGDLGGLSRHAELVLLDPPRSADGGAAPASALRCDALADDLEALRLHLGLDHLELLGHSAGANVVLRYAERHPERVARLVLVTPSVRAVAIEVADASRSAVAGSRADQPWYEEAAAALARLQDGAPKPGDGAAIAPFSYGRWDDAVAAYDAQMNADRDPAAAAAFGAEGAFDPPSTRAALAALPASVPVTIIAGAVDVGLPPVTMQTLVELFPGASLETVDGAGHFPWVDDPGAFVAAARRALERP